MLKNFMHTLVLFLGMAMIMSLLGFILAGVSGVMWAIVVGIIILVITPNIPPAFIFSLYGGQFISQEHAPILYQITQELANRAKLPAYPELYYLPSQIMNAFSVGTPSNPAIGISDALLSNLTMSEIIGVLAHEISHIQHNDLRLMNYADVISRITHTLAFAGFLLIIINLPLYFLGLTPISWLALVLLIGAPTMMSVLQRSLSRLREFEADRQAVLLTADPAALASALTKIAYYESSIFDILSRSGHSAPVPSIMRTHPLTEERIAKLLSLKVNPKPSLDYGDKAPFSIPSHLQKSIKKPRWHIGGYWY